MFNHVFAVLLNDGLNKNYLSFFHFCSVFSYYFSFILENNNLCETKNNNNHRYSQHNKTQILDYTTMRNEITKKDEIILDLKVCLFISFKKIIIKHNFIFLKNFF